MELETMFAIGKAIFIFAVAVIAAASALLKVISKYTKTKKDDKVYEYLVSVLKFLSAYPDLPTSKKRAKKS